MVKIETVVIILQILANFIVHQNFGNKKSVSIKTTIKMHFPFLWQLRFYFRVK